MVYSYQRYIARVVLRSVLIVVFIFSLLVFLSGFVGQIGAMTQHYTWLDVSVVAFLRIPRAFDVLYAVIFFVGVIFATAQLTANNTLVILRASGVSALFLLGYILLLMVPFLLFFSLFNNSIAALATYKADQYRDEQLQKTIQTADWLPEVWSTEQGVIFALNRLNKDGTANKMQVFHIDSGNLIGLQRIDKPLFDVQSQQWRFTNQQTYAIQDVQSIFQWQPQQTAHLLWLQHTESLYLTLFDLYKLYLRDISLGVAKSQYQYELYNRLFAPIVTLAMLLLGMCLVLRADRSLSVDKQVGLALLLGLSIDYVNKFASKFIFAFSLPAGSGSVFVILICLGIAWYLMRRVRL